MMPRMESGLATAARRVAVIALCAVWISGMQPVAAAAAVIKLATLVPEGSIWDKALRQMGEDWKQATGGRVTLRIYPGGIAGSEDDVLRKIRIGQLQAGALSAVGLESLDPAFKILTVPLFYESYDELAHVLKGLAPDLERRLESRGFVLVHWGNAGWAHFFSRRPVRTIDDLRELKIYVPAGSKDLAAWWKDNGFKPVELASTDVMTGLQTGMFDVLPSPPLAALSLQWFRQTPYMLEIGVAPVPGATVVARSVWQKLEGEDRASLLAAAAAVEKALFGGIPAQEREAIVEMKRRGLEVTVGEDMAGWRRVAEAFGALVRDGGVPPEVYERAVELRDEYRRTRAVGGGS